MKRKPVRTIELEITKGFITQQLVTLIGKPFTEGELILVRCKKTKQEFTTSIAANVLRFRARGEFGKMFHTLGANIGDKLVLKEFSEQGKRVLEAAVEHMPADYWNELRSLRSTRTSSRGLICAINTLKYESRVRK